MLSWNTRYLIGITVSAGSRNIRRYALEQTFQRFGTDNDDDHPPVQQPRAIANQSSWCAAMEWVYDLRDPQDPNDNFSYTPDALPMLTSIDEFGFDANNNEVSRSGLKDATFTYTFLGTGQYALYPAYVRYCFPYLTSVETLYGPVDPATPTTAYTWRVAQQPFQTAGSLEDGVVGRHVNVVERETTYSGFADDAPAQNVYFDYVAADMQGDDDTFQGFKTVNRCHDAACGGSWTKKETLSFETRAYSANDAALNGRLKESETRAYPNALMAETVNTWGMLDGDGNGTDPSRVAVLNKQVQSDYRGGSISARTEYKYDIYGNTLQTQEYGEKTGATPWRTLEYVYMPNIGVGSDKWLVNLAWRETIWDGLPNESQASKIVRRTRYRYDGVDCDHASTAPTQGQLMATDAYVPGDGLSCGGTDYNTTSYTYDANRKWQVTRVTDPAGRYQDFTWTNATQLGSVSFTVAGMSYATAYTYDSTFRWQVKDVTQPNGATTRYTYDVHGRLDQVKAPDPATGAVGAAVKDYNYGDTANPFFIDEIIPVMSSNNTRTFYDAVGRPLQVRRFYIGGGLRTLTDTQYDTFGRVVCTTAIQSSGQDTFNPNTNCATLDKITSAYDVLGEQTSQVNYNGATTTTQIVGRERKVTDGLGNLVTYESDELGRLIKVTQPTINNQTPVMTYAYDLADNLLKATGPNNTVTTLEYDKLGRKTKMNDPDMGIWTYSYDGSGNLIRQVDAKSQKLCFYYDAASRLTYKTSETGNCPQSAGATVLSAYIYATGGAGKGLVEMAATGSAVPSVGRMNDTFIYDYRGRVTSQIRDIGGQLYTLNSSYDAAGRIEEQDLPDSSNEVITYVYDGEFPDKLHSAIFAKNLVSNLTFNHRGQLTEIDRNSASVEDTVLTYHTKNENFQVYQIKHGSPNGAIPDFWYTDYDAIGQLRTMDVYYTSAIPEAYTFTYDAIGRLASEQRLDGPTGTDYHYSYTYGPGGNIGTRKNETSGAVRNYVYDIDDAPNDGRHYHALENVTGDGLTSEFINDANGNMTSREINTVTYTQVFDEENRLESVEVGGQTTSFYYDTNGNRVLTVSGTGSSQVKIYTPFPEYEKTVPATGSATERIHYYLGGQYIATWVKVGTQTGKFYFVFTDRQGSVANMRQSDGTWVSNSTARYDAFGGYRTKPAAGANPGISDRGYTGHRMNNSATNDLGLIYMNARYYMPEIGRFISADTIVPESKDPQSYNRYSYSYNDPINYTDPSGHCAETGDDACWSLAEQLWNIYGIDLEFLGVLDYDDLSFFGETLTAVDNNQRDFIIGSIQESLSNPTMKAKMLDKVSWDVFGVRGDFSISAITGINLSGDFIWNFVSQEFGLLASVNGTIGVQAGISGAGGVFFGFNALDNSAFQGWGTGLTFGGAIPGVGGTVQYDVSGKVIGLNELWHVGDTKIGATLDDTFDLTVMYSSGVEAELSYSFGYTWFLPLTP